MATSGKIREKRGGEAGKEGAVSRERERGGVDEERNGGNGVLINWRVIKSRSDTPMVRRVDTLQRIRDGERYRFSRRYPATSRPLFPRETEKEREKEMIETGANRIERFDTFSSLPFPFDDIISLSFLPR